MYASSRREHERRHAPHALRRVDARDQALRRRFLVAGRAVDLAGEKQARDRFVSSDAISSVGWMKSYSTA